MKNKYLLPTIAVISLLFSACVNALISCSNVSTLNTDLGYVDVSGLNFGNLVLIDTTKKLVNNWKVLSYDKVNDVIEQESSATLTNNIKSGLSVSLTGSEASSAISAGVDASLSNELNFRVVNYSRKDFKNPVSVIAESDNAQIVHECKDPSRNGQIVMLVTSMTNGDTSQIYIGKDRAINANASSQKIGKFTVKVTYNCSGNYEKTGKQVNLFFKPQFFMCDPARGLVDITGTRSFDLTKYSFVQAVR